VTKLLDETDFRAHLHRLAMLGARGVGAESCFVYLPSRYPQVSRSPSLQLASVFTSRETNPYDLSFEVGEGVFGWVAQSQRANHLSPVAQNGEELQLFDTPEEIGTLVALPLQVPDPKEDARRLPGVLVCESIRPFAFSNEHCGFLDIVREEISSLCRVAIGKNSAQPGDDKPTWDRFMIRASDLTEALGVSAVEALRIRLVNRSELETRVGTPLLMRHLEQLERLFQQTLPPHFPLFLLPWGEFVVLVDNMMASFFKTRLEEVARQVRIQDSGFHLEFSHSSLGSGNADFEQKSQHSAGNRSAIVEFLGKLITETTTFESPEGKRKTYEYRRA
jgi:hypothetical protein